MAASPIVTKNKYDIVIIGAGLAGLSAACTIKRQGHLKIGIIEGASVGSNNPSPLTFTEILDKYELNDCIKCKLSSFSFHNYKGSIISYSFPGHPLSVLDYHKACLKLFSLLDEGQGSADYINKYAIGFSQDIDRIIIQLKDGTQIFTDIMIDCSGRSKFTASRLCDQDALSYYSHVYGATFSNLNCSDSESGYFLWPCAEFGSGGGWFYQLGSRKASFGYATISDSWRIDLRELETKFWRAVKTFEPYSSYLKDASLENIEKGTIPITYASNFVHERIMIIGDAAGMATNWTCMGIEPALKYGSLAGELAIKAIAQRNINILREFQYQWEKDNKATYDFVAQNASILWTPNHYLWEWVIKNDLAFLSPAQIIDRMQSNSHLLRRKQIITRALIYKIRSIVDKKLAQPQTIIKKT